MWLRPRARGTVRWNDRCSCITTGWDRCKVELADTRARGSKYVSREVNDALAEAPRARGPILAKRQKAWRSAGPMHQNPSLAPMGLMESRPDRTVPADCGVIGAPG